MDWGYPMQWWCIFPEHLQEDSVATHNYSQDSVTMHNYSQDSVTMHNYSQDSVTMHNYSQDSVTMHNYSQDSVAMHNYSQDSVTMHNYCQDSVTMHNYSQCLEKCSQQYIAAAVSQRSVDILVGGDKGNGGHQSPHYWLWCTLQSHDQHCQDRLIAKFFNLNSFFFFFIIL